ncbi:MAG: hypothetical protein ACF8NJ_05250 [Phycisphaerales bacterium JB038]
MPGEPDDHPDDLVTLLNAASAFEARVVEASLQEAGIDATAVTVAPDLDTPLSLSRERPVAPVLVHQADLARARTHLAQIREEAARIDWSEVNGTEAEEPLAEARLGLRLARRGFLLLVLAALVLAICWIVAGLL